MSLADQSQQWFPTSAQVTVLQARGLKVKGKNGTNDSYAIMQVAKEKFSTCVAEKSVTPMWKEQASFDLPLVQHGSAERGTLRVHVMHRALVGPDKLLGQAVVNLLELHDTKSRNKTEWHKLLDKAGKSDQERGEVLLDIQFMRNNMTASMFDLSATDKSKSRIGKFKDKLRGKKKGDGGSLAGLDSVSAVVPASFSQVLTDSEGDEDPQGPVGDGREKSGKKKLKLKSLFSQKSNLQKNVSQSMSFLGPLPERNQALSGSRSSGLNVEPLEGKKKFKFGIHKRSGSTDSRSSQASSLVADGAQTGGADAARPGGHAYAGGPAGAGQAFTEGGSQASSTFSLSSSGRGSMEDLHRGAAGSADGSFSSYDSLRVLRSQTSPWRGGKATEEEEEEEDGSEYEWRRRKEQEDKARQEEQMRIERRRQEEEDEQRKRLEEERTRREMEEQRQRHQRDEEERMRKEAEEEMFRREEERARMEEEERERLRMREEERKIREKEEERFQEVERIEEERKRRNWEEEQEQMRVERQQSDRRRMEEEEEERRAREEEEERRNELKEREERMLIEREQEEQRVRMEEERLENEERARIEEARKRHKEEMVWMEGEEKRRQEEKRREEEQEEEDRRQEERERTRRHESFLEEEGIRRREQARREEEEEMEEQRREEEEREQRRREDEERERLKEEQRREQEEEKERLKEEQIREEGEREQRRREDKERERLKEGQRREQEEEKERLKEEQRREDGEREQRRREDEERERLKEGQRREQEEEKERLKEEERREDGEREQRRREDEERERLKEEQRREKERLREGDCEQKQQRWEEEEKERLRWEDEKRGSKEDGDQLQDDFLTGEQMRNAPFAPPGSDASHSSSIFMPTDESPAPPSRGVESARRRAPIPPAPPSNGADPNAPPGTLDPRTDRTPSARQSSASRHPPELRLETSNPFFDDFESDTTTEDPLLARKRRAPPLPSNRGLPGAPPGSVSAAPSAAPLRGLEGNLCYDDCSDGDKDTRTGPGPPGRQNEPIASDEKTIPAVGAARSSDAPKPSRNTKGPAPAKPDPNSTKVSVQIHHGEPQQAQRATVSTKDNRKDSKVSTGPHKVTEQRPSTNPFDEDDDDGVGPAEHWSSAGAKTVADTDGSSSSSFRSLKTVRAPLPPQNKEPSKPIRNACSENQEPVSSSTRPDSRPPARGPGQTRPATQSYVTEAASEQGGRVEEATRPSLVVLETGAGPASPSRRTHPVKPLIQSEQLTSASSVLGLTRDPLSEIQQAGCRGLEGKEEEATGPFSQLTRVELVQLLQTLQGQLSQRDSKISELEQYIDNLLVRIMEEEPSILMSMCAMKR